MNKLNWATLSLSLILMLLSISTARGQITLDTDGNVAVGTSQPSSNIKLKSECTPNTNCTGTHAYGVLGEAENDGWNAIGVGGFAQNSSSDANIGVRGYASAASSFTAGIHGRGDGGYAGYFLGDVHATGNVTENSDERFKQEVVSLDGSGKLQKII